MGPYARLSCRASLCNRWFLTITLSFRTAITGDNGACALVRPATAIFNVLELHNMCRCTHDAHDLARPESDGVRSQATTPTGNVHQIIRIPALDEALPGGSGEKYPAKDLAFGPLGFTLWNTKQVLVLDVFNVNG